jgi:hypothetical protein
MQPTARDQLSIEHSEKRLTGRFYALSPIPRLLSQINRRLPPNSAGVTVHSELETI